MATVAQRVLLADFALANPIYSGASVTVLEADLANGGAATTTKATLYTAPTGTTEESNPFRLDGDGKLSRPVYIDVPVIARVTDAVVASHDTGVLGLVQRFREEWETALVYQVGDVIRDGAAGSNTGYLYICAATNTASAVFADDLAAGLWALYVTGGTGGSGGSGIDVIGTTSGSFGTSSANYIKITGNTTGNNPRVSALGSDTTIDVHLVPKGVEGQTLTQRLQVRDTSLVPATGTGPTASGAMPYVSQGLVSSISGTFTNGVAGPFSWFVSGDNADASGVTGGNVYYMFGGNSFGGSSMKGGRIGLNISHSLNGGNTGNNSGDTWFHTGISSQTVSAYRDGGVPNDYSGHLFGMFVSSELRPGAKYWDEVKMMEGNVSADALSSVGFKFGITLVTSTTDAVEADVEESFLAVGSKKANATASSGLRTGILFGGAASYWGIPAHGALIEATPTTVTGGAPPAMTAAFGMDMRFVTFSGAFLRSANFAVDGSGNVGSHGATSGVSLQTRSAITAKTAVVGSIAVLDGGTFTTIPTLTIAAPPTSGTTATGTVETVGLRIIREIVAAGTGYALNNVLNVVGGTSTGTAQLLVTEVTVTGGITQAILQTVGSYSVIPTTPIAVTGGTGTGATFGLGWKILTCAVSGAGTNYPEFPAPIITVDSTGLIRRAKLLPVMTATQGTLVLNSGAAVTAPTSLAVGDGTARQPFSHNTYISPVAGLMSTAPFILGGNAFGTVTSGAAFFRQFNVNTDTVNASAANGGGVNVNYFGHTISAGAVGGRTTLSVFMAQLGATTSASGQFYVAGALFGEAAFSAGGSAGAGNSRGNLFAANHSARLKTGAGLYWNSVVGEEVDISVQASTSVVYKVGFKVVQWADDAVSGTTADYAYGLNNQANGTAPGWDKGFAFGAPEGWWPIKAAGTIIGTYASTIGGGPAMAAAYGVDFSAVTFSTSAFKSPGFLVNGSGTTTTTGQILALRVVTAAGAVTVSATDDVVVVNKTVGAATTVNLPAGFTGRRYTIKDGKGDAAANNITITPAAGNIDGAGTLVISANYGKATIVYNGTQWNQTA